MRLLLFLLLIVCVGILIVGIRLVYTVPPPAPVPTPAVVPTATPVGVVSTPAPAPPSPEPTPTVYPTLFPEPPKPTWFISLGEIKIDWIKFCLVGENGSYHGAYAEQFPSSTPEILCEIYYHSKENVALPIILILKKNGEEWKRQQLNLKFGGAYWWISFGRMTYPTGNYQADVYWNDTWVATGNFQVY